MFFYLLRRLGHGVIVIIGVTLITFFIPASLHANVARLIFGQKTDPAVLEQFNRENWFDRPIWQQYLHYMDKLIHGDLGISFNKEYYHTQVSDLVGGALFQTLWIVLIALTLSVLIAVPLGMAQAIKRNSAFDYTATSGIFILYSTPSFILGTIFITVFSSKLHIFPYAPQISLRTGPFARLFDIFQYPKSYVLPIAVLTCLTVGGFSRFMRGSVLDTLVQDYIRTARAKGCGERRVLYKHAFRNAIIPIVTILGLALPALFAGAVITESLFNLQGMGTVTVTAVNGVDIPVIMAATLLVAVATVVGNIISDLSVAAIDPRIRLTGAK